MEIRTRIAPSPTGDPHVGTVYIALFNYVFSRHFGGKFILRIEDTDQKRSRPDYEQNIYNALHWAGLTWDEGPDKGGSYGPYRQSERLDIYQKYIKILLDKKKAYKCFATPQELQEMRELAQKSGKISGYDRRYRNLSDSEIAEREKRGESFVVRLKVPLTGDCVFEDKIKGTITTPWADIDDQILMKSDGFPTYHFACVVDDHLMGISHVIRGDEWISSTPKHILLYDFFEWERPTFMHMPLLLGADGRKLSKRRNPTSTFFYRDSGYLPEALLNFLSLMGYSMPGDQEMYSLDDLIKTFDPTRFGKSGAFFDIKKLDWLNQKYVIQKYSEKELLGALKKWQLNDDFLMKLMPLAHTRIKNFGHFFDLCDFFFINELKYQKDFFVFKEMTSELATACLQTVIWSLDNQEDWSAQGIEKASHEVAELFKINHKKMVMPLLFAAIMGKTEGPPLYASFEILGKDKARARLLKTIEFLGGISGKKLQELKKTYDRSLK
jgi:glutamyl-tRNA synthetase